MGPIPTKEEFCLETRPFLTAVFKALNCSENDYLVLFSLCLLRAIQENEGEKKGQKGLYNKAMLHIKALELDLMENNLLILPCLMKGV